MKKKKISLPIRMLIGMVLGIIVGIVVGPQMAVIKPFGTAFINLLKMAMVPVVALSITLSVATVDDLKSFGRFGGKTFLTYVITTCIAAAVAICYGFLIQPGAGFAGLSVTEHNPAHGAEDGSTTAALAAALQRALS